MTTVNERPLQSSLMIFECEWDDNAPCRTPMTTVNERPLQSSLMIFEDTLPLPLSLLNST